MSRRNRKPPRRDAECILCLPPATEADREFGVVHITGAGWTATITADELEAMRRRSREERECSIADAARSACEARNRLTDAAPAAMSLGMADELTAATRSIEAIIDRLEANMSESAFIAGLAKLGCVEITETDPVAGRRKFRCDWSARFRFVNDLLRVFREVEINGEDMIRGDDNLGSPLGFRHAVITAKGIR